MGLRFRRSIRLGRGIRLNLGSRSASLSLGGRGASVNIGPRGTFANLGIPGSGVSYRTRLDGGGDSGGGRTRTTGPNRDVAVQLALQDDGEVLITDQQGAPLDNRLRKALLAQHGEFIQNWLGEQADAINAEITALETLHLATPPPDRPVVYTPREFEQPYPQAPTPKSPGLLGTLLPWVRRQVEAENRETHRQAVATLQAWKQAREAHEKAEAERKLLIEKHRHSGPRGADLYLETRLGELDWPRETEVDVEVSNDGRTVFLDVDLPEIEMLPAREATVAGRGLRLNYRKLSDTRCRKLYMNHVHGIGFRLIGEVFQGLPRVHTVVCSGYSQRVAPATGQRRDEYLYSVRVAREDWARVDFTNLDAVEVVAALDAFELRRQMTKTGIFRPIEPFSP